MKKLIRVENERIIEIRPVEELDLFQDEKLLEQFKKQFIEVEVPEGYNDIEILTKFIYKDDKFVETTKFLDLKKARLELDEIQVWFAKNDYIPNKIITGEWETSDERWRTYLADREVYRHRQDELKELLGV